MATQRKNCLFSMPSDLLLTLLTLRLKKKVREKSRGCHNHKPQPFPDPKRKRKPTNLNKHKPNKRTKSTKNSSLFPKRGNRNTKSTEVTFPPQFQEYYERKPNAIKSFGLRIAPRLESANINTKNIQKHSFSDIPSCCITKPSILFDLPTAKKSFSDKHLVKQKLQELQSRLSDYQHIYIDGSKVEDKVGQPP